jgi:hypothetical protein
MLEVVVIPFDGTVQAGVRSIVGHAVISVRIVRLSHGRPGTCAQLSSLAILACRLVARSLCDFEFE